MLCLFKKNLQHLMSFKVANYLKEREKKHILRKKRKKKKNKKKKSINQFG